MMIDFLGKELAVGDTVIMIAPGYRQMIKGTIINITPQKIRVEYFVELIFNTLFSREILQNAHQLVKVNV
jgi:hypothetical protein